MVDLPFRIKAQIGKYEPIETEGLTLYPICVKDYDSFLIARPSVAFLQQSLPVALMGMPLMQAYYQIDVGSVRDEQLPTGLMAQTMLFLCLSLRIGEDLATEDRLSLLQIRRSSGQQERIECLEFTDGRGVAKQITPACFQRIRPILAAQNGIELQDETVNPELLAAEEMLSSRNTPDLDVKIEQLINSVAAFSGADESDIYEWPILKLQCRERSLRRLLDYIVCGIGEAQGAKWKNGNPVPHPWFQKAKSGMGSLVSLDDFAGGAAKQCVEEKM